MSSWGADFAEAVAAGLEARADPLRAVPMAAYMRDQFEFLGVPAPEQKVAVREAVAAVGKPGSDHDVAEALESLWARPEREFRYAGCMVVVLWGPKAGEVLVPVLAQCITVDPWWDTCDVLARRGVGPIVRRHPALRADMDAWLAGDNLWLTRTALLHMGGWKHDIDRDWVFAACLQRAGHPDFFIRKAIGWILRDLAWVDPEAVVAFVDGPGAPVLSGLSKREALKNVAKGRAR